MTHSTKRALWGLGRIIIAVIILIVFLSPFVFMLGASFRLDRHIFANISPISLRTFVPRLSELTLDNFVGIFHIMNFGRALANSLRGHLHDLKRVNLELPGSLCFFPYRIPLQESAVLRPVEYHAPASGGGHDSYVQCC